MAIVHIRNYQVEGLGLTGNPIIQAKGMKIIAPKLLPRTTVGEAHDVKVYAFGGLMPDLILKGYDRHRTTTCSKS